MLISSFRSCKFHILHLPSNITQQILIKMDSKVVIVADDDSFVTQQLGMIFGALKVQAIVANDGKQAFEAYKARNGSGVAYVLMDLGMPVMDGYDSTKQIRAFEKANGLPPCKILGLSGGTRLNRLIDNDAKTKQACLDSGMNDLLQKPAKKSVLEGQL